MFKASAMRSWNLNAINLEATADFYKAVLGAEETPRMKIQGATVAHLKVGDQVIGVFDASQGPRDGVPHHTFTSDGPLDSSELIIDLEAKGVKIANLRLHGSGPGYSLYVEDPDGNRLELSVDPHVA
jgi:predicted enzyme related to lactoylglutathione lyase